jgi:CDP-4-dehydro-6-deoxyglucose reductase
MPNVHYLPTLSRENWEGPQGYVHSLYETIVKENQQFSTMKELPAAQFFLCGWKNMIDEAKEKIIALGYDKKSIHQELYG